MNRHEHTPSPTSTPHPASIGWLRALNFVIAQVELGLVPFIALYLQSAAHWSTTQVGAALAFGNVVQLVVQTPIGALVDRHRAKRWLVGGAVVLIGLGCVMLLWSTSVPAVWASQGVMGIARAVFPPALAAITLGMFGKIGMDRQTGIGQAFNAGGSVFSALVLAAAGHALGLPAMFQAALVFCVLSLVCVQRIRGSTIDFEAARGNEGEAAAASPGDAGTGLRAAAGEVVSTLAGLWRERTVRIFMVCAVLFYAADVAMVPLVTQLLGKGEGGQRALLMTAGYIAASQVLFVAVAPLCGRLTSSIGRKPLLLFAFAALALRAVLSAASDSPMLLLAAQCTDALSTGVFGVLGVLIVADLTRNTGGFNVALGALSTVQGVGAFVSNGLAGYLADAAGQVTTFLVLGGIAALGFAVALALPETRPRG
ncbi:MFS transporter [Xylophilus sp. GOD-11R]|uniref:MFS transporter n=1 Tax=Xylophilus sp. GOD-11R TaxID=3089814 RepID=UPI00298D01F6|nr:MFS transporter [Xylophilus sp. GOD-11R]WPB58415.1 MFS transporter [Xylophilus sp. GOD-11R]